jgi:GNAT superfamily N-acetyltransferase
MSARWREAKSCVLRTWEFAPVGDLISALGFCCSRMPNEISTNIKRDEPVAAEEIEALRVAVGWDRFENKYERIIPNSYTHFAIRTAGALVGFLNVISDGIGDAFLVDLMVQPAMQRRELGRALVKAAIEALKADGIKCIQVTFNPHLESFYRACGFHVFKAGIIDTHETSRP